MRGFLHRDPFNLLDTVEERLYNEVLGDVKPSIDHKCRYSDEMEAVNDRPVFHDSDGDIDQSSYSRVERKECTNNSEASFTVVSPSEPKI